MDDVAKRLTAGLKKAIQAEVEGYHFYMMAASNTPDPKGRSVFTQLAEDEKLHANFLQSQYDAVQATGDVDKMIQLGSAPTFSGHNPIFSDKIRDRLGEAHYEMTALSVGIQLELGAQQFYRHEAEAAADPTVKAFYEELAKWEAGHYHALLAQQEDLQEDYWGKGRFSPF